MDETERRRLFGDLKNLPTPDEEVA